MKLEDEIIINAEREIVFAALNNEDLLRAAIPGCECLEKTSENDFTATIVCKVGPMKIKFMGQVTLADVKAPESYTMTGSGKGGPAGFAKMKAKVNLEREGNSTRLKYVVDVDIGGKLAQMGGRLLEGTAKKYSSQFFQSFEGLIQQSDEDMPQQAALGGDDVSNEYKIIYWIGGGILTIGIIAYFFMAI